jgi:hypothetical protein
MRTSLNWVQVGNATGRCAHLAARHQKQLAPGLAQVTAPAVCSGASFVPQSQSECDALQIRMRGEDLPFKPVHLPTGGLRHAAACGEPKQYTI